MGSVIAVHLSKPMLFFEHFSPSASFMRTLRPKCPAITYMMALEVIEEFLLALLDCRACQGSYLMQGET